MAKSLEDTTFYRYHRLLALNEVGGHPDAPALPVERFHAMMQARARDWPHGLTATATHDTKRGEDARARILALTELSGDWTAAVGKWKLLNASHLAMMGAARSPSAAFEYMLYQILIGAWPPGRPEDSSFVARIQAFALKAAREGKQETSWLNPNPAYENGIRDFITRILDRSQSAEFMESFDAFARRASLIGALNSLSQLTLKATIPGVPDFYQGTELWDLSLVDPDNRRPVDFRERRSLLARLSPPDWSALTREWQNGHIKFAWTRQLLEIRRQYADVFTRGDYRPLEVTGPQRDRVIAFARTDGRDAVIVAAGRTFAAVTDGGRQWPAQTAYDGALVVDGYDIEGYDIEGYRPSSGGIPLANLFRHVPAAVLGARITPSRPARRVPSARSGCPK
jgi:(1->4)-alpha-D-glucan 1-alpha-D-glucosylmutase